MAVNFFDKYTKPEFKIGNYFVKMINSELEYIKNNDNNITDVDGICNGNLIELQELSYDAAIQNNNIIIDIISAFKFYDINGDKNLSFDNPNINLLKKGKRFTLGGEDLYLIHFEGDNHFSNHFKFTAEEEVRFLFQMIAPDMDFESTFQNTGYDLRKCLQILYKPLISKLNNNKNNILNNSLTKNSDIKDIIKAFQISLNIPHSRNYVPINVEKLKKYFDTHYVPIKRNNKKKYEIDDKWESAFSFLSLGVVVREQLFYTKEELENMFIDNSSNQNITNVSKNSTIKM